MSCNNVQILNFNHNIVEVGADNKIIITDQVKCNSITIPQPVTNILQINAPGPRGPQGAQGPQGENADAGGSDTQIQFNSGSDFGGSSNFTFDYTTNTLVLTGSMDITGSLTVNTINVGQNTLNFINDEGKAVNSLYISDTNNITIATGSIQTSGSSFFSGSFVGALEGTSSWAESSSYALSASYLIGGVNFSTLVSTSSFNFFTSSIHSFTSSINNWTSSAVLTSSFNTYTSSINQATQSLSSSIASLSSSFIGFSGSYNTGSFTGSFKGDGSGLTNISASAVIGLNLSQITSGSYSASISNNQLLVNTGVNAPSFTGSLQGTSSWAENYIESDPIFVAKSSSLATTGSNTFIGGQEIQGTLQVSESATFLNGITVYGSSSFMYITSSQLAVSASTISVNVFEPVERFGGLIVYDSGSSSATASFLWDSQNNHFIYQNVSGAEYNSGMFIAGPKNNGALGAEQGINTNALTKGQGGDHITSSQITDDGTTVTIPGNLSVTNGITGSLLGTAATASYVSGSIFDSNNLALSASHALTASFALNGGGGGSPFYYQTTAPPTGSEPITGSMWVSSDTGVEYNLIYDGNSYQWVQQTLPVGPQGPQGVSGTNNIDGLTTTTLVGVLTGDGSNVSTLGYTPENVASKSIDDTFAANSDALYPSQKAVKTYVDNTINFADEVDYAMIMQQRYFFNI